LRCSEGWYYLGEPLLLPVLPGALSLRDAAPLPLAPLLVAPVALPGLLCCTCRMHCSLRSPVRLSHWAAVRGAPGADDSVLPDGLVGDGLVDDCAKAAPENASATAEATRYERAVIGYSSGGL
jgi:hypothetical protein